MTDQPEPTGLAGIVAEAESHLRENINRALDAMVGPTVDRHERADRLLDLEDGRTALVIRWVGGTLYVDDVNADKVPAPDALTPDDPAALTDDDPI